MYLPKKQASSDFKSQRGSLIQALIPVVLLAGLWSFNFDELNIEPFWACLWLYGGQALVLSGGPGFWQGRYKR